jgi:hypothetical protein
LSEIGLLSEAEGEIERKQAVGLLEMILLDEQL